MKKALLTLVFAGSLLALQAQKNISLHFIQKAGSEDFSLNTTFTTNAGYDYQPTRLQYYLSHPAVIHDGGQQYPASNRYFLIDAGEDVFLDLGQMEVENIEGVIFSIGVDEGRNHLDPSGYPAGHPLAPQNPSMHWGWAAGYRFIAMEGKAGSDLTQTFELHSIGDELYQTVTLITGAEEQGDDLVIHVVADYNMLLENIDVSGGTVSHGNLGPAAVIMENIGSLVFSPQSPSSVKENAFQGSFSLAPNPSAMGTGQAACFFPEGARYQILVTDLAGRVCSRQAAPAGYATLQLNAPAPGMYLVQVWQDGVPVATKKWVVTQ